MARPRPTGRGRLANRIAAVLYAALGVGFGAGAAIALDHYRKHGRLPMTPWGFRALAGPAEALGPARFTALGWTFVAVCALDVVAGTWLWKGQRRGATLGLATTPVAFGLSLGFALPIMLVGIPIRVALVLAGRRNLI